MENNSRLNITPGDLMSTSNTLSSLSDDMKRNLDEMTGCIKELTEIWRDKNGTDFVRRYTDEVEPQLSKYYNKVRRHSEFISGAANAYRGFINETSASINSTET